VTTIRCRDAAELVCEARDRALDTEEQQRLAGHLSGCERCRAAAGQFRQLFEQLDELLVRPDASTPPFLP
jgi:predicted anti-sigma-YlaC factor YlaD